MGAPIPAQVRRVLPLLGSDSDGEALAALRAVRRILSAAGASFVDLADALPAEPEPIPFPPDEPTRVPPLRGWPSFNHRPPRWAFTPKQEADHRRTARRCLDVDAGRLRQRERAFLADVARHPGRLSVRQREWLELIATRLELMEAA